MNTAAPKVAINDLLDIALALIRNGVSIIPIDHRTKRPAFNLLPKDPETGKPSWRPFQSRVATEDEVRGWISHGAQSIAIVCGKVSGGLEVLDFDVDGFCERWAESVGPLGGGLVTQRSGGGGYGIAFRSDDPGPNQELAWAPADNAEGREIAIETRGEGGYLVVAPSLHPSGNRYAMVAGTFADVPRITAAHRATLLDAARRQNDAPFTRKQIEASRIAVVAKKDRASVNGQSKIIDAFNEGHRVRELLSRHNYVISGNRGKRPGGESYSVILHDDLNTSYHHSGNDPLKNGHQRDPFDVFCVMEHGGDVRRAVRDAARLLGVEHPAKPPPPPQASVAAVTASVQAADLPLVGPVVVCMADVEAREIEWLWPGRIPLGRVTLLVGKPGEGKSYLTSDMAAHVSTGRAWPDGRKCPLGSVLFISAEDDPRDTIRPRLDAHGADVSRVHLLASVRSVDEKGKLREVMFTLADVEALKQALAGISDVKLIVIDPIGSFLGGRTDAHRDNEVRGVLAPVAQIAEQTGAAVVMVAHRRKSVSTSADDTALGSRAFTGLARAVWHLSREKSSNRRLLLPGKNNLAREGNGLAFTLAGQPIASIHWEKGEVTMTADQAMADETKPGPDPEARNLVKEWLVEEVFKVGLVRKVQDVRAEAKSAGYNMRTVHRAKDELGVKAKRDGYGGEWNWILPATSAARPAVGDTVDDTVGDKPPGSVILSTCHLREETCHIPTSLYQVPHRCQDVSPPACAGAGETEGQ